MNAVIASLTQVDDSADWRRSLANAVRDPDVLIDRLGLGGEFREPARQAAAAFPLLAPESFLARIAPHDPDDPLLRQVLPMGEELAPAPGFTADPLEEAAAHVAPGVLQKYPGRALFIASGACAVHCRYCFRREYPYTDEPKTAAAWEPAFEALRADPSIHEVLLSGGDPLVLTNRRLGELIERLEAIPHLKRLRIHTRLPIVLPDRVTPSFLDLLRSTRLTPIVVVHANHANELVDDCAAAVQTVVRAGVTVLNQAVLLRGVNDDANAQAALCERLIDLGVVPYYLHQLDRVAGTSHFEVEEQIGREIVAELRRRLPGYAVPQYVREIPGVLHKSPLAE